MAFAAGVALPAENSWLPADNMPSSTNAEAATLTQDSQPADDDMPNTVVGAVTWLAEDPQAAVADHLAHIYQEHTSTKTSKDLGWYKPVGDNQQAAELHDLLQAKATCGAAVANRAKIRLHVDAIVDDFRGMDAEGRRRSLEVYRDTEQTLKWDDMACTPELQQMQAEANQAHAGYSDGLHDTTLRGREGMAELERRSKTADRLTKLVREYKIRHRFQRPDYLREIRPLESEMRRRQKELFLRAAEQFLRKELHSPPPPPPPIVYFAPTYRHIVMLLIFERKCK